MKTFSLLMLMTALLFSANMAIAQTSGHPVYKYLFQLRKTNGALVDTALLPGKFKAWSKLATHPSYVKWKNQPFAVVIDTGVALTTDSSSGFSVGDTVAYLYYQASSTGNFAFDYLPSNIRLFINDATSPNMDIVSTSNGLVLIAKVSIAPNTKLSAAFKDLLNLFPGDANAANLVKYQ